MADQQMVSKEPITATVRILYWRDIPSKVEVEDEACVVTRSLSDRYQNLIHKLSTMQAAGDDASVGQWREAKAVVRPGDAITVAVQVIDELEGEFDDIAARSVAHPD
jgi:Virulence factor